ncbi:unnamed protein product [Calypogeia fissa]
MAALCSSQVLLTAAACLSLHQGSLPIPSTVGFCRSPGSLLPVKLLAASSSRAFEFLQRRKIGDVIRASVSSSSSSDLAGTENKLSKLDGIKLYDPSGAQVSLIGLWERRPAVVAFARHFGCILCRKRAALLQSRKAEMDAAEVALVLIAPGSPEQARQFVEQTKFSGEVYADPDHASYEALEFVNGATSVLNPKSGLRLLKAFSEGYHQDWELSLYEDTVKRGGWQQGGILVAGPGANTVRYLFKDAEAGDEPEMEDVISACCST